MGRLCLYVSNSLLRKLKNAYRSEQGYIKKDVLIKDFFSI